MANPPSFCQSHLYDSVLAELTSDQELQAVDNLMQIVYKNSDKDSRHDSGSCLQESSDTIFIDGKCVKVFTNIFLTWSNAQNFCRQTFYNGTLVEPVNELEMRAVKALAKSLVYIEYTWIGANDLIFEGSFVWTSDERNASLTSYWDQAQPDNYGNQDCVALWRSHNFNLDDWFCETAMSFMCQTEKKR
ncbi:lectin BRA-3-like [Biomphalaria glabrata]|uniref:Lectin BRA-3-like n=1 Tax=Biomphalaria glabrata TaxID=6526 RepID=A0A9W2YSM1_BIOGL|nr:lectin BRA-3-like [Biomphalaria glabrata]